jgi:hypothetical protein
LDLLLLNNQDSLAVGASCQEGGALPSAGITSLFATVNAAVELNGASGGRKSLVEVHGKNMNLRARPYQPTEHSAGPLFDERGDFGVAYGAGNNLEFVNIVADPQKTGWIR